MYTFTRWVPQDRSGKVCWLLNELGQSYEVRNLEYKKHHDDPEYRQQHPLGAIPVLQDAKNDITMFESGAICLYLAEQHAAKGLIPLKSKASIYQWVLYNYATLEPALAQYWRFEENDPEIEKKKAAIDEKVLVLLKPIEAALQKSEYLVGDTFTVADIPIGQSIHWLRRRPIMNELPALTAYVERLRKREAAQKAELFTEA